jgi:2-keto-4-pentenoate hydratase/2-oxohepta-3-ene-1,7-dioic acid hydratase in catechol pathway
VRRLLPFALALCCACAAAPEPGVRRDGVVLRGEIAAPEIALTFARRDSGAREVLLVRALEGERVLAVVVPGEEDPIEALARRGWDALVRLAATGAPVVVPLAELGLPAALGTRHVAAGANFREHGREIHVDTPFLFPKWMAPTPWSSTVPAAARLDYEVELCFVALRSLSSPAEVDGAFGVLLCDDFTERWALVKEVVPRIGTTSPLYLPT